MIRTCRTVFLFFLVTVVASAHADWINLSGAENSPNIAEITISKSAVEIDLEIHVSNLDAFVELLPESFFGDKAVQIPPQSERLGLFAKNGLQVVADGKHLPVELSKIERRMRKERPSPLAGSINPYTRQIIPGPPEDKRVFFAKLRYPFTTRPNQLIFTPPLSDKGTPRATIGFTVEHLGVTVIDYRYLSEASKLTLEWDDPWYSRFEQKQLKRWQQSGVSTFLYIEPYQVRHETLVRIRDMEEWIDFGLRGSEFIEEDEFDRVREKVSEFLLTQEKVLIGGKKLKPVLDRVAFVESKRLRSRFIETPERIPLNTAMLGVVFTYLTDGIPQKVTAEWNLFNDRINKVPARMTDPAGPFPYTLDPNDNVLSWENFLKSYKIPTVEPILVQHWVPRLRIPLLSVLCLLAVIPLGRMLRRARAEGKPRTVLSLSTVIFLLGSVLLYPYLQLPVGQTIRVDQIDKQAGKEVLQALLVNIYRSFDFREEEDVYDRLAHSVQGELLERIYLESRKSLIIEQAGGAQAKVQEVAVKSAEFSSTEVPKTLEVRAEWTVLGKVGHWGHEHSRQNRYKAQIDLDVSSGSWKLADLELLQEERVF